MCTHAMEAAGEFVLCRVLIGCVLTSCLTSGDNDNTIIDVWFAVASVSWRRLISLVVPSLDCVSKVNMPRKC